MKIVSTQYSLNTQSFEIYISGCNGSCDECCNPELKDFSVGSILTIKYVSEILEKVKNFDNLIKHIWILGGDPLDNNIDELRVLIGYLKTTNKNIWIWTRYSLEEIPNNLKILCDYIKCGEYDKNLKTNSNNQYGVVLSTSNQKIYKKGTDYEIEPK